jgi:uncharacterized protein
MRTLFFTLLLLFSVAHPVSAQVVLSSASKTLLTAARAGDAEAQYKLAVAYDWGQGAPRSGKKAKKWYLAAASQGHDEAQNGLGSVLQAEGKHAEALKWYQLAADQKHSLATNNLAAMYDHGQGVEQNRQQAFDLYMRAANLGETHAMWNVANTLGAGHLGEPDLVLACVWTARTKRFAHTGETELHRRIAGSEKYLATKLTHSQLVECADQAGRWQPES